MIPTTNTRMNDIIELKEDGIIYVTYPEVVTEAAIERTYEIFLELAQHQGGQCLILVDMSGLKNLGTSALRQQIALVSGKIKPHVKKDAIIGINSTLLRSAVNIGILISGRNDIRIFENKETAIKWLKG